MNGRLAFSEPGTRFAYSGEGIALLQLVVETLTQTPLQRLMESRGLPADEARRMLAAQMPASEKRDWVGGTPPRAPFVIENEGDRAVLEQRARAVWDQLVPA
jgi:CubicO group peptidase (beta-lactamase class C family)